MSNIIQKPRYISEVIGDRYKEWDNEFIIFDSPTAAGKTYFILNVLSPYAKLSGKRILYLCNRKKLRIEIQEKVRKLPYKNVEVMAYQTLQRMIIKDNEPKGYDYIAFDEIHYLTSDSFNEYTDVAYQYLMKQKDNVCVLMSATAKSFFRMLLSKKKVKKKHYYTIEKDYSYVKNVYFYKSKALTTLIDGILEKTTEEKILVFCNSEKRLIELYEIYKDKGDYYCSEDNKNKKLIEICNPECIKCHSDDYITFDKQILFSTKVLDCGVDLKDASLKHIFTEIFDLESMVQSLGRKRSLNVETDTCDFYIKEYTAQGITCFKNKVDAQLKPIRLLKKDEQLFNEVYGKNRKILKKNKILYMNFGLKGNANNKIRTNGDIRINNMMFVKYNMDYQEINRMLATSYISIVCRWLGNDLTSKVKIMDVVPIERDLFLEYLENIIEKPLFKDEREELKHEFEKIGLKDRTMGINTLNGKLKDKKYPFIIFSEKDKRRILDDGKVNPNRDKRYWIVTRI